MRYELVERGRSGKAGAMDFMNVNMMLLRVSTFEVILYITAFQDT